MRESNRPTWIGDLGLGPRLRWALLLSGGAAFGAVQVGVIETLIKHLGLPASVTGCSVGAENGLLVGEGRHEELRPMWRDDVPAKGRKFFMKLNFDINHGFFSLKPLRKEMEKRKAGKNLLLDTRVTVTDLARKKHLIIHLNELRWKERISATICSSCQPMIHERERFRGRWLNDGGVSHVLPTLPDYRDYDFIAAVFCSPLGDSREYVEASQKSIDGAIEQAFAAIDVMMDNNVQQDYRRVRRWKEVPRAVFAPKSWRVIGDSFDATKEAIDKRLDEGDRMAMCPVWHSR